MMYITENLGFCVWSQINASFVDVQRKVEMNVKKELSSNHESVTKNMDKVSQFTRLTS